MADAGSQQQLLTLIRDFAQERSQGERRVSDLKRRAAEIAPALDAAFASLEATKRSKETVEQELRGSEVELALSDAAIHAHESRISLLQEEILKIRSDIAQLKNEESISRDDFIDKMSAFNKEIRKFQEMRMNLYRNEAQDADDTVKCLSSARNPSKALEDKLALVRSETQAMEREYLEEQSTHGKVLKEVANLEKSVLLVEAIARETKELQELSRQTAESEQMFAASVEQLRKKYTCPRCHLDNMGNLQALEVNNEG